jgi:hypothetical protein
MTTEDQPLPPVDAARSPRPAAWAAMATLLSLLASLVIAGLGSSALPGTADRYISTQVARNIPLLTADATLQLAFGTALIVLAVTLGGYLVSGGIIGRLAVIGGILGGAGFIAAGAVQQETVFYSVFIDGGQASRLGAASGSKDLTALNLAIGVVAGGLRSSGSYAFGLAWIGWGIIGMRTNRLPRLLGLVGLIAGLAFALTNWIGPLAGPLAFFGSLIWLSGLVLVLFRRTTPVATERSATTPTGSEDNPAPDAR